MGVGNIRYRESGLRQRLDQHEHVGFRRRRREGPRAILMAVTLQLCAEGKRERSLSFEISQRRYDRVGMEHVKDK